MKQLFYRITLFFDRLINPKRWSLKIRVVYTTGFILIAGTAMTLFTISYVLLKSSEQSIENRIDDFSTLISHETENRKTEFLMLNTQLAARDDIQRAFSGHEVQTLHSIIKNLEDNIRLTTQQQLPTLQFYTAGAIPLYNSRSLSLPGDLDRKNFEMITEVEKKFSPQCGVQVLSNIPYLSCALPVIVQDIPIGTLESLMTMKEVFSFLELPPGYGIRIALTAPLKQVDSQSSSLPFIVSEAGQTPRGLVLASSSQEMESSGTIYAKRLPLANWQGSEIGSITLFFNGQEILQKSWNTIIAMTAVTILGVIVLSISLYWNVKRIRNFFDQMKAVLIASHSKDFTERFPASKTVLCSTTLKCSHKECPVFNDPDKICYLETGDKAISPKWRSACIALNKYGTCEKCPVYQAHYGDETIEMGHVVNTVMGLWENFLDKVGILLSDVFRTSSGQMPSLEDVSNYLEQMAALTSYSYDLHGVYSKEEVYRLLEWVFEKQFGLTQFNLLEVNSSENKMTSVIDRYDINISHREVYLNCDLCRAKRVAQDVVSANSPFLCPYFGIESTEEVRCCIPMVMGGRVGAVFTFIVKRAIWEKKEHEIPIIKKYLDETAPILSSLRLLQISKDQALRDPLTQCHNRRFMDEYLIQLEHQQSRQKHNLGFIMADLDHFKMVNDEFGHLAGDEVLKQLTVILKQNIRKSDLLIRYGGEEFLIILLDVQDENASFVIAEKIRCAVEEAKFALPANGILRKTLSMGTANFPADAEQFYQIIKYADVALYQAKEQGRNRVVKFVPEMWKEENY